MLLKFQKQFPRQTALELALRTGASPRHCERALGGYSQLGERFLQALLRSDFGKEALLSIMDGSQARWFGRFKRHIEVSELRRAVALAQRGLEALEREAAE